MGDDLIWRSLCKAPKHLEFSWRQNSLYRREGSFRLANREALLERYAKDLKEEPADLGY